MTNIARSSLSNLLDLQKPACSPKLKKAKHHHKLTSLPEISGLHLEGKNRSINPQQQNMVRNMEISETQQTAGNIIRN